MQSKIYTGKIKWLPKRKCIGCTNNCRSAGVQGVCCADVSKVSQYRDMFTHIHTCISIEYCSKAAQVHVHLQGSNECTTTVGVHLNLPIYTKCMQPKMYVATSKSSAWTTWVATLCYPKNESCIVTTLHTMVPPLIPLQVRLHSTKVCPNNVAQLSYNNQRHRTSAES